MHLYYTNNLSTSNKRYISGTVAALTAIGSSLTAATGTTAAIVGGTVVAGAGGAITSGIMSAQAKTDASKASANAGRDATAQAQAVEKATKEAEAVAEQTSRDEARKKLAKQTRTVFTSGLGLLGTDYKKKTTLGGGQ